MMRHTSMYDDIDVYYEVWKGPDSGWVMGPKIRDLNLNMNWNPNVFTYFSTKEDAEMALMLKNLGVQDE